MEENILDKSVRVVGMARERIISKTMTYIKEFGYLMFLVVMEFINFLWEGFTLETF